MKTKLILDINKTQYAQLNSIVTGRVGDKASNVVNVYVDNGVPYNLTGLSVFFECAKPDNTFVRDNNGVKIIDATQGYFEYTFPTQTFGFAGKAKRAFFSIENNSTVRATTQDFELVTLADAQTNRIPSETYISELDELISEATNMVDRASGSPRGVYATLAALKAALPNGGYGIYIVSADGNWYYWNNNTWASGGLYQSTGIADESITNKKIANGSVTNDKLAPGSITNSRYADKSISEAKIADKSISERNLIDKSVTPDKIKFSGIERNKGILYPLSNVDLGNVGNVDYKNAALNAVLDIKIHNADPKLLYRLTYLAKNDTANYGDLILIDAFDSNGSLVRSLFSTKRKHTHMIQMVSRH